MKKLFILISGAMLLPIFAAAQIKADIPEYSVSLSDYGARPDGTGSNTEAFEKAVKALEKKGGGHLVVSEGVYVTGPIVLKDCMDLHLEKGAIILFSPVKTEFTREGQSTRPCISASKRHDVSISGEGIIDGNGRWWRGVKRSKVSDSEWKAFLKMGGTVTEDGAIWYPFNLKAYPNVTADARSEEKLRAHLVRFTDCDRVSVSGVTLQNSPRFHLVPQRCRNVTIEGVTVRCPWNAQNGDGIDLMQCQDVLVRNCMVDVGDDGICLKAGAGEKALQHGPCKNIVIEYNTVFHAHGGFVIGSEFSGGMENITVRHNSFCGTDTGLRFKSAPERGGKTSGLYIHDINMTDIRDQAIVFETSYADRPVGHEDAQAATSRAFVPEFCDILMERIVCIGTSTGIKAKGNIGMIHGIVVRDSTIMYDDADTDIDDPDMISLENVRFVKR